MNVFDKSLQKHEQWQGKIKIDSTMPVVTNQEDLSLAYTPGVAASCKEIYNNEDKVFEYTRKWNLVAVVTDGSAVLGLGNIGPMAGMPVMEGKAVLFKSFADVDAFPICLSTQNTEEIIKTIKFMSPTFGGINLEDISAPRCFEIEERLKEELDIPVFHDDQHGTAIVVLAGILNSLKLTKKNITEIKVVISGAGAAGISIAKLLLTNGCKNIILCNSKGAIYKRKEGLSDTQQQLAEITNPNLEKGQIENVINNSDVFIGVSKGELLTKEMVKSMNEDAIVFAMANPVPEIMPDEAKTAGVKIIGTGRSDFVNQINNVLAFPGLFRGALDVRAKEINKEMKISAAKAIAALVSRDELDKGMIIPKPFDKRVVPAVAKAVKDAAISTKVSRI